MTVPEQPPRTAGLALAAAGVGAGFLSGLFGVGGGLVMVPALVLMVGVTQHRAHATSLAAIIPIAAVGAVIFGGAENVNLVAAGLLVVGSLAGVQAGTRLMDRLSSDRLALLFGAFVIAVALAMLVS